MDINTDENEEYVLEKLLLDNPTLVIDETREKKKRKRRAKIYSTRRNIRKGVLRELERIADFIDKHREYSFDLMLTYFRRRVKEMKKYKPLS